MRFSREARTRRSAEEQAAAEIGRRVELVEALNGGVQKGVTEMASVAGQDRVAFGPIAGFRVVYQKRPQEPATFSASRPFSYAKDGQTIADVNLQFDFTPGHETDGKPVITRQTVVDDGVLSTLIGEHELDLREMQDIVAVVTALPMNARKLPGLTQLSDLERIQLGIEIEHIRAERLQDAIEKSRTT